MRLSNRPTATTTKRTVPNSILHIVGMRTVIKVVDTIIGAASILVTHLETIRSRANESLCNQGRHLEQLDPAKVLQHHPPVSVAINNKLANTPRKHTAIRLASPTNLNNLTVEGANVTIGTNRVHSFKTNNR